MADPAWLNHRANSGSGSVPGASEAILLRSKSAGEPSTMATEKQAKRALDVFEQVLTKRPNVVGLGIVPKHERSSKDGMAIGVYVTKKVPQDRLSADELVPDSLEIPGKDGPVMVPTRVIEQGEVSLESLE